MPYSRKLGRKNIDKEYKKTRKNKKQEKNGNMRKMFKLSKRSLGNLEGVNDDLSLCVQRAIEITDIDFGVIEGLRTKDRQRLMVEKGLSQTMKSKHLSGHAVDLMAYLKGRPCWELRVYEEVAESMRFAAKEQGLCLRWGAAWHITDICSWDGDIFTAMHDYIQSCRLKGKQPFIDAPHFEIP